MLGTLFRPICRTSHAGGMLRHGLGVAEADGAVRELQSFHEVFPGAQAAAEFKRDQPAARRNLTPRDVPLLPLRKSGIGKLCGFGAPQQPLRKRLGQARMLQRAQLQRFEAAQHEKRHQRRDRRACEIAQPMHEYVFGRIRATR